MIGSIRTEKNRDRPVSVTCTPKGSGEVLTLFTMKFSVRNAQAHLLAGRLQFAFVIGYTITIHRSQGLTLPKVAIQFNWNPVSRSQMRFPRRVTCSRDIAQIHMAYELRSAVNLTIGLHQTIYTPSNFQVGTTSNARSSED